MNGLIEERQSSPAPASAAVGTRSDAIALILMITPFMLGSAAALLAVLYHQPEGIVFLASAIATASVVASGLFIAYVVRNPLHRRDPQ
jgi:hypothetical protein